MDDVLSIAVEALRDACFEGLDRVHVVAFSDEEQEVLKRVAAAPPVSVELSEEEEYACEKGCGFTGSFGDVAKHEATCAYEPPAPVRTPRPVTPPRILPPITPEPDWAKIATAARSKVELLEARVRALERASPSKTRYYDESDESDEEPSAEERQRIARQRAEYDDAVRENARVQRVNATPGFSTEPVLGHGETREMSLEEAAAALARTLGQVRESKDKGNLAFAGGTLDDALMWYSAATRCLNGWDDIARQLTAAGVRKPGDATPLEQVVDLRVGLAMNTAACNLKQKAYAAVLANCREAFAFDRKCVKALYRSGVALEALGRMAEAEDAFRRAAAADPSNREIARCARPSRARAADADAS